MDDLQQRLDRVASRAGEALRARFPEVSFEVEGNCTRERPCLMIRWRSGGRSTSWRTQPIAEGFDWSSKATSRLVEGLVSDQAALGGGRAMSETTSGAGASAGAGDGGGVEGGRERRPA